LRKCHQRGHFPFLRALRCGPGSPTFQHRGKEPGTSEAWAQRTPTSVSLHGSDPIRAPAIPGRFFSSRRLAFSMFRYLSHVDSSRMAVPVAPQGIDPNRQAAQPIEIITPWSRALIEAHLPVRSLSAVSIWARWEVYSCFALARLVNWGLGMLNQLAGGSSLTGQGMTT
jgi:hypothetical protein